ncbi:C-terminal binding protein [Salinigranum rubrum]|uniref:C-terminal binding protein n=1 Tax=Salinigranum rubrum TaxID=755307 RepID=A0A2I8VEK8_9EURY|nr:C-terminal binding protein [Salinigranum rubrum]AUV80373.1 C-terminal binding protein [Salinigranum rubrum]
MKVVVTDYDFPDLALERELAAEAGVELAAAQARTPAEVVEAAEGADALLVQYAQVDRSVFEALDLTAVGRYGIGVDSVDLDAATEHGVRVLNVPAYCLDEVSTHAFALLLACVRKVARYDREIRDGRWDWTVAKPIHRFGGGTLGLAGFGKIPRELGRRASAFDLDVIAYDPYVDADEMADHGVTKVDFDALLDRSDFVSVHVPLTDETRHLFDARAFERMNDDAIIVNTSRGATVDVRALHDALRDEELAGAGIDVMPEEPPEYTALFDRDEVVCTPHVAWYSEESYEELRRTVTRDVLGVLRGDDPEHLVNTAVDG